MAKIVVVLGPTASGKSDLAVELAKKFNGEVISADSRQVYRGMDIGTGKITKREMRGVPHHLLGVVSPKHTFTVAIYKELAERAIKEIIAKGKVPIICGGTGLYINSLIYNYSLPQVPPDKKLRKHFDKLSAQNLFEMLRKLDPERAGHIDRFNKRRLVRALEILIKTGRPIPPLRKESHYEVLKIGLNSPPQKLKSNIHKRLIKRLGAGMIAEAKKLHERGLSWQRLDDLGLEYRYVSRHLRGLTNREKMIQKLLTEIFHYAKRQMTWFKRDKEIHWLKNPGEAMRLVKIFLKS